MRLRIDNEYTASQFRDAVYAVVAEIPCGRVMSYGQIADLIDSPGHARLVGHVLSGAPPTLPCHRVVNAEGRTVPSWPQQRIMLEKEGVMFKQNGHVDMNRFRWLPPSAENI